MIDLSASIAIKAIGPIMALATTGYVFNVFQDINGGELAGFFSIIALFAYFTNAIFSPLIFNMRGDVIIIQGKIFSVRFLLILLFTFISAILVLLFALVIFATSLQDLDIYIYFLILIPFVVFSVLLTDVMRYENRAFFADLFNWNGFYGSCLRQLLFILLVFLWFDLGLLGEVSDNSEINIIFSYTVSNIILSIFLIIFLAPNFFGDSRHILFRECYNRVKKLLKENLEFVSIQSVQTQFFLIPLVGVFGFDHLKFELFNLAQIRTLCMQPLNFMGSYMPFVVSRGGNNTKKMARNFRNIRIVCFGSTFLCVIGALLFAGLLNLEFVKLSNWSSIASAAVPILMFSALGPVTRVVALTNRLSKVNQTSFMRFGVWSVCVLIAIQVEHIEAFMCCLAVSFGLNQLACHYALPKQYRFFQAYK